MLNGVTNSGMDAFGVGFDASKPVMLFEEFSDLRLIGRSPVFLEILRQIKKTASTLAPVLIKGDTGTGKELAARAIHQLGSRRKGPFVPVNCGAIPEGLMESEWFGHEKGAFTDARQTHAGLVEQANGGTLFLDEVDNLSRKGQVILLRFLQDQQYRRLGATQFRQADTRVITASNANLQTLSHQGEFRQDLLFRIAILHINLPPLSERAGDVEVLANYFLERMSLLYQQPKKRLSPATLDAMRRYAWPGNVRELENFIHRAHVLAEGETIEGMMTILGEDCPFKTEISPARERRPMEPLRIAKAQAIAAFEKSYLQGLLATTGGNVTRAAHLAGTERRALGKLLKKYGLSRHS